MEGGSRLALQVERNPVSFIRLHPDHKRQMTGSNTSAVSYTLGPRQGKISVEFSPDVPSQVAVISSQFAHELGIRRFVDDLSVTVRQRELQFGTILGILCSPHWNETERTLKPGKQMLVLEKLAQTAARERVLCYAFAITDVDLQQMQVTGYRYHGGQWRKEEFPFPNVVYDQVISRKRERQRNHAKNRGSLLAMYGDCWFNPGFLDKWQVNEWLRQDSRTQRHVPSTIRYTHMDEAVKFLRQYPVIYCKPVHGSLGLGIFRIEQFLDGTCEYQVRQRRAQPVAQRATSARDLFRQLQKRLKGKPYILQQGIGFVQMNQRPFDIRVVMQRDGQGTWKRTKMFARVAEKGQFTANLTTGGEAYSIENVLEPVFANTVQRRKIIQSIRRLSRTVPDVIEEQSGQRFGELGLDLGVDAQGGVWIIEVNSKPWKKTVATRGRQDLVDLAFQRPIQYATYLASRPE